MSFGQNKFGKDIRFERQFTYLPILSFLGKALATLDLQLYLCKFKCTFNEAQVNTINLLQHFYYYQTNALVSDQQVLSTFYSPTHKVSHS